MRESRRLLISRAGIPIETFVSPFGVQGDIAKEVKKELRELGYVGAFLGKTGSVGPKSDPFDLPRLPVYEQDSLTVFRRKIDGAYDWLGIIQPFWVQLMPRRRWEAPHSPECESVGG